MHRSSSLLLLFFAFFFVSSSSSSESLDESSSSLLPEGVEADDECLGSESECALSALQLRGVKVAAAEESDSRSSEAEPSEEDVNASLTETDSSEEKWSLFHRRRRSASTASEDTNPIQAFNDRLDTVKFEAKHGLYYQFATSQSQLVWEGMIEGLGDWADKNHVFPLASASKLFTAFACMYTMQLKPRDWYPQKYVHQFRGWETFKDFPVHGTKKRASLTVHHLLTHTSGLPFAMRSNKEDVEKVTLFFMPGTKFGYTLGHRVIGWMLRDYWRDQPEARSARITTVQDTFKWLFFDKMGLSEDTRFSEVMTELFGYEGQAGDASIQSTGADLMKLAITALRRGKLPSGQVLISEKNWNKWAVPNLLPGGKLTKDLVDWEGGSASWANWNVGGMKEKIMQQSGDYGWNYFGATYDNSKEIGWCGFFSSCLRVTYENSLAFVMMQRDVSDLKKSKPYLVEHFAAMSKWLQCKGPKAKTCAKASQTSVFCEVSGQEKAWTDSCPSSAQRGKGWGSGHRDEKVLSTDHTCFVPTCSSRRRFFR